MPQHGGFYVAVMTLRAFPVLYAADVESLAAFYVRSGFVEYFRLPDPGGTPIPTRVRSHRPGFRGRRAGTVVAGGAMGRREIGPRMFGERLAYNRAVRIDEPRSWLFVAGHEARDDDGSIAHAGDMAGQMRLTVARLGETVREGGLTMSDVVQIRIVTTDLAACKAHYDVLMDELASVDCRPTSLLAEVSALSDPEMLLEIEAVAAR